MGSPAQDISFSQTQQAPLFQSRQPFPSFSMASSPPGQAAMAGLEPQVDAQAANASCGGVEAREDEESLVAARVVQV